MEIERNPVPPHFNKEAIKLITELCFRKNDSLKKVDGIFVYSSITGISEMTTLIEKFLSKNISNQIFITGGITPKHLKRDLRVDTDLTEADTVLNALRLERYKNLKVHVEKNQLTHWRMLQKL